MTDFYKQDQCTFIPESWKQVSMRECVKKGNILKGQILIHLGSQEEFL